MEEKKEILRVENLKKYFYTPGGVLHAVDDISFTIKEGETLGVVGESGCGKSTMGRTILRLHERTDGKVFFQGNNIFEYNKQQMKALRKDMQIIFQDPFASLNPRMTVSEAIAEPLLIQKVFSKKQKVELKNRVEELIELVGLAKRLVNSYPHELDGGRRQRIGIARALALNPKFVVCDEPVSALDVSIQAQILNMMMKLQKELKVSLLFISHDIGVIRFISDRVGVMYLGSLVEETDTEELFAHPLHPYTKALFASAPDPYRKRKDFSGLKGEQPVKTENFCGCAFASRCPHATEQCRKEAPVFREVKSGHKVACHMV